MRARPASAVKVELERGSSLWGMEFERFDDQLGCCHLFGRQPHLCRGRRDCWRGGGAPMTASPGGHKEG
jgi:hypothetical protein